MEVKLVVFKSTGQRKDISIKEPTTIIGRGEECGVHVPIGSVSRRHCEMTLKGKDLVIKDLASSNGTYVNNARVTQARLKAGDRISVGPIVFTVQLDGMPKEIRPIKIRTQQLADGDEAAQAKKQDELIDAAVGGADDDAMAALSGAAKDDSDIMPAQDSGMGIPLDDDPISALEALAADPKKKKKPGK